MASLTTRLLCWCYAVALVVFMPALAAVTLLQATAAAAETNPNNDTVCVDPNTNENNNDSNDDDDVVDLLKRNDNDNDIDDDDAELLKRVIDWSRSQGAYINENVEIRSLGGTLSGLFAKEPLEEGTVVSRIPWHLIVQTSEEEEDDRWCNTILEAHEVITNPTTPYEEYLSKRSRHHVPSFWSEQGQEMLLELIGDGIPTLGFQYFIRDWLLDACSGNNDDDDENNDDDDNEHDDEDSVAGSNEEEDEYDDDDENNDDEHDEHNDDDEDAYVAGDDNNDEEYEHDNNENNAFITRKNDILMTERYLDALYLIMTRAEGPETSHFIPYHDLINHRNGHQHFNTDPILRYGEDYQLVTKQHIPKGAQLQNSYNQCRWCTIYRNPGNEDSFVVTPQIFELYGFVELYPQRWVIPWVRLLFDIDYLDDDNDNDDNDQQRQQQRQEQSSSSSSSQPQKYNVSFPVPPSDEALTFLSDELERLEEFAQKYQKEEGPNTEQQQQQLLPPQHELDALWEYHDAIVVAFTEALQTAVRIGTSEEVWEWEENDWYWEE